MYKGNWEQKTKYPKENGEKHSKTIVMNLQGCSADKEKKF
jgi:hypothetical protein